MKALHWMDRYRKEVLQLSTRKHGINVQYLYDKVLTQTTPHPNTGMHRDSRVCIYVKVRRFIQTKIFRQNLFILFCALWNSIFESKTFFTSKLWYIFGWKQLLIWPNYPLPILVFVVLNSGLSIWVQNWLKFFVCLLVEVYPTTCW